MVQAFPERPNLGKLESEYVLVKWLTLDIHIHHSQH